MALLQSEQIQGSIAFFLKCIAIVATLWLVAALFGVDVAAIIDKNAHKLFDLL